MTMMRAKCWLAGLMMLGLALQAAATEGGGGAYQGGAEGFMTGALPPPGQYIINYSMYYSADLYKGGDGRASVNDFDVHAFADVVRFINVTPVTILGGNWAQHICVPFVWEDVGLTPGASRIKDNNFGLGDIVVDPIIIGWHMAPFHVVAGIDTYIPVGKYHEDSLANIGRNYWTFEPVVAVTYLNEGGQELSTKMMYDINTCNTDATSGYDTYTSGQEFHMDFVAAQHCGPLALGLGGYWYYQTTDDKADGTKLNASQGRQIALGPQVSYQCGPVNLALAWDHEFATKNKPQGEKFWLKAIIPL